MLHAPEIWAASATSSPTPTCRSGCASGSTPGSRSRKTTTCTGASVVIAKRLESAAPPDGILVSDGVKQLLAGKDFSFTDQGDVALKGFEEPVRAWAVAWD